MLTAEIRTFRPRAITIIIIAVSRLRGALLEIVSRSLLVYQLRARASSCREPGRLHQSVTTRRACFSLHNTRTPTARSAPPPRDVNG